MIASLFAPTSSVPREKDATPWFLRQVVIWSIFGLVYAAPCVLLARILEPGGGVLYHLAMLCGILTWIPICAGLTSIPWWRKRVGQPLGQALRFSMIMRAVTSLLASLVLTAQLTIGLQTGPRFGWFGLPYFPDFFSGALAVQVMFGSAVTKTSLAHNFLDTYSMTMVTGALTLAALLVFTLMVWICIWASRIVRGLFAR